MEQVDVGTWIPLVEQVDGRFVLAREYVKAAGPLFRQSWKSKAFVSHMISHFDDPFEHLLDNETDDDPRVFDVDPEFCELLAEKYKDTLFGLSAGWYARVYRAKLLTLRMPVELVLEAKQRYLMHYHNHLSVSQALLHRLRVGQPCISERDVDTLSRIGDLSPQQAWLTLEAIVSRLQSVGAIDDSDVWDVMNDTETWDA